MAALAAERAARLGHACRVLVDGPWFPGTPCAGGASDVAAAIDAAAGASAVRVRGDGFLRPASLRLEYGRDDADSFYLSWLDVAALRREVLEPAVHGSVLPALRDPESDRSIRAGRLAVAPTGLVVIDAAFLIGVAEPADLSVHVHTTPAALARRTPPGWEWTAPSYSRHQAEHRPRERADVVLYADHPERPAIAVRAAR